MSAPGLCGWCAHARIVATRRGSRFYLCALSRVDPDFPRYPALPVLRCEGHAPGAPASAGADETRTEEDR